MCKNIVEAVAQSGVNGDRLPQIYISGCPNCCARHASAGLGFAGRKVTVDGEAKEAFMCYVGGQLGMDTTVMVESCGTIKAEDIPAMVVELGCMLEDDQKNYK